MERNIPPIESQKNPPGTLDEDFLDEHEAPASKTKRTLTYIGIILLALLLIVGLRFALMKFFFPSSGSGESVAQLAYLYNKVVQRSANEPAFKKAGLDQKLFENDSIRTYENSHAEIRFSRGDEIRMDENTLIIIKGVKEGAQGKPGQYFLFVENGSVIMKLQGNEQSLHFIETPGNKILLSSAGGGAEIGVQLQADGKTRVTSYSGTGKIDINGKQMELGQNEYLLSDKNFVQDKRLLPPSNIAMQSDEEPIIFGEEIGQDVTFNWVEVAGAKAYGIEVAKDPDYTKPLVQSRTSKEQYTYRVIGPGNYYWRVKSLDPSGPWVVNGKFTFIYDDPHALENVMIDPQKNLVAESDESTTIFFQSDYPLVTFTWEKTKRAWGYRLEVFQDADFEQLVFAQTTQENSHSIKPGLFRDAKYYWQVIAVNETGEPLHVSEVHQLNLIYDNAVPFLTILKPEQASILPNTTCPVVGILPKNISLYINGKEFPVDSRGKFKGEITVPTGTSHVTFKAMGKEGRIEYHARQVTVTTGSQ